MEELFILMIMGMVILTITVIMITAMTWKVQGTVWMCLLNIYVISNVRDL